EMLGQVSPIPVAVQDNAFGMLQRQKPRVGRLVPDRHGHFLIGPIQHARGNRKTRLALRDERGLREVEYDVEPNEGDEQYLRDPPKKPPKSRARSAGLLQCIRHSIITVGFCRDGAQASSHPNCGSMPLATNLDKRPYVK